MLDLRILLFSKYLNKYNVINENLIFTDSSKEIYHQNLKGLVKLYRQRRYEAHLYFFNFVKLNNLKINKNLISL